MNLCNEFENNDACWEGKCKLRRVVLQSGEVWGLSNYTIQRYWVCLQKLYVTTKKKNTGNCLNVNTDEILCFDMFILAMRYIQGSPLVDASEQRRRQWGAGGEKEGRELERERLRKKENQRE